jgi:hypothetical protein
MRAISSPILLAVMLAMPQYALAQLLVSAPAWTATREWSVDLSADGRGIAVAATAVADRGDSIVVPLVGSRRVVFINPNGGITNALDGMGRISALGFLGDTLWIADGTAHRFKLLVRSGSSWTTAGTRTYGAMFGPTYVESDITRTHWVPVGLAPDMRVVALNEAPLASRAKLRPSKERAALLLRTPGNGRVDTLGYLYTSRAAMRIMSEEGEKQIANPLRYRDMVAMDGLGQRVTLVNLPAEDDTSSGGRMVTVSVWNADGSAAFWRSFPTDFRAITAAALDSSAQSISVTDGQGNASTTVTASLLSAALREANPPGSRYAPIGRLVVGRDSTIWLKENAPGAAVWLVLSPNGTPVGRVRFPGRRGATLLAADSRSAWFLESQRFARFAVVRYRISSPRAASTAP